MASQPKCCSDLQSGVDAYNLRTPQLYIINNCVKHYYSMTKINLQYNLPRNELTVYLM